MTEDLVIVGAGGFSRQIAELVEDLNRIELHWTLLGFLDDAPELRGSRALGYPVLGTLDAAGEYRTSRFIIGIANYRKPDARQIVADRLGMDPARYATLLHPSASISPRALIGAGTAILQNVVVSHDAVVGNHVLISPACLVSHDTHIEDCVTFASRVAVSGSCRIGRAAYLGAGCTILDNIRVGERAVVGIGAVVLHEVPPEITVFGCPARSLRLAAAAKDKGTRG